MTDKTTDDTAKTTSEDEGKNTEGEKTGADTDTAKKDQDAKQFTQADLNRIASKTRQEERDKIKLEREKDERERLEKQAKEQGEFEKLATDRQKRIEELEPQLESLKKDNETLRTAVADIAKSELKGLPEEVRDISPAQFGEDKSITNPLDVLAWLPKGKKLAEKLTGSSAVKGAGPDPKPINGKTDAKAEELAKTSQANAFRSAF
jgi:hypothetical protein